MGYQYAAFGDPLAFAKTQEHWSTRGVVSASDKALALLSYEPIWSVYQSSSEGLLATIGPRIGHRGESPFCEPDLFPPGHRVNDSGAMESLVER